MFCPLATAKSDSVPHTFDVRTQIRHPDKEEQTPRSKDSWKKLLLLNCFIVNSQITGINWIYSSLLQSNTETLCFYSHFTSDFNFSQSKTSGVGSKTFNHKQTPQAVVPTWNNFEGGSIRKGVCKEQAWFLAQTKTLQTTYSEEAGTNSLFFCPKMTSIDSPS